MNLQNIKDRLDNNLLLVIHTKEYHEVYTKDIEGRLCSMRTQVPALNTHIDHYIITLNFKNLEAYDKILHFNNKDIIITYIINKDNNMNWYLYHNLSNIKFFKFGELDVDFDPQQNYEDNDYVYYNTNKIVGNINHYYKEYIELDNDIVTYLELEKYIKND